jgi:GNAT superfamily N-acetyltransferase
MGQTSENSYSTMFANKVTTEKWFRAPCSCRFQTVESTRKWLSDKPDGLYVPVGCVDEEVVGNLDLSTAPSTPRRRHAGDIAMAVRDDWQGKGIRSALMEARLRSTLATTGSTSYDWS